MPDTLYNLKHGHITVANASTTTADATDLNLLDGITNGTVAASKVVIVDANKDIASFRHLTATGTITAGLFSGKIKNFSLAMAVNGAVAIPLYSQTILFTKVGVLAATLADPTATTHDGVRLTFINTLAHANTIDNSAGSGFNAGGAASDIATSAGAIGDYLIVEAYQGVWYVIGNSGFTLA